MEIRQLWAEGPPLSSSSYSAISSTMMLMTITKLKKYSILCRTKHDNIYDIIGTHAVEVWLVSQQCIFIATQPAGISVQDDITGCHMSTVGKAQVSQVQ